MGMWTAVEATAVKQMDRGEHVEGKEALELSQATFQPFKVSERKGARKRD